MKIEREGNILLVKTLLSTAKISIPETTEFIYSDKTKRIYCKQNLENNMFEISVYSLKGELLDKRTYNYYCLDFYENSGFACIKYYDYYESKYFTAKFIQGAGIANIAEVT